MAGSRKFLRLVNEKNYAEAIAGARRQIEAGAQIVDVNMDDPMLDAKTEMTTFLRMLADDETTARVPVMIDSSSWEVVEAALKCLQGKGIVNSISLKEGEQAFLARAKFIKAMGAAVVVMAFDEKRTGRHLRATHRNMRQSLPPAHGKSRVSSFRHHFRPQHPRSGNRH